MKCAFVTYVATDTYLPGVLVLQKSLQFFNDEAALTVIATKALSKVSIDLLESIGCTIRIVEDIPNPFIANGSNPGFNHYTKLHVFNLIEYDRIVFLDADLLICSNIKSLFSKPHMSSVVAGGLIAENKWSDLNGGLLVIHPSAELFKTMLQKSKFLLSEDGTDQGFLQSFYDLWKDQTELHLDHRYNVPHPYLQRYCEEHNFEFIYQDKTLETNISVIHFWGPVKPWHKRFYLEFTNQNSKFEQALELWYDFYAVSLEAIKKNNLSYPQESL